MNRETLLQREFTRPKAKGIREFTIGIWRIANDLNVDGHKRAWSVVAWLMDEKNPLDLVRSAPSMPSEQFDAIIEEYEMTLSPVFVEQVKLEVKLVKAAAAAIDYDIEPKPDEKPPTVPEKKS